MELGNKAKITAEANYGLVFLFSISVKKVNPAKGKKLSPATRKRVFLSKE